MAPAFIQGVSGTSSINAGLTCAFATQNTAAGSALVAVFTFHPTTTTLSSVTDSQNNTWVVLPAISNGSNYQTYFCYALNTAGGSKPTLTLHVSAGTNNLWYCLGEYSGVSAFRGISSPLAVQFDPNPTNSNPVASVAGDLIIGLIGADANYGSAPTSSNSTVRKNGGNGSVFLNSFSDAIALGASTTVAWGWATNVAGAIQALAFVPTPASGGNSSWLGVAANNSLRGLRH